METTPENLECDILLFFATQTERQQLERGAAEFGFSFEEKRDAYRGVYFDLGTIGPNRVRAVKTRMGPFFHQGSATQSVLFRSAIWAPSIIQVGMAFGIDRRNQKHGDVLVSKWVFPYDYRIVEHVPAGADQPASYRINYETTEKFRPKKSLLQLFELERREGQHDFEIHFGGLLTGGSRIFSQIYLRELLAAITNREDDHGGYVGGEMEGVGLLAAGRKSEPVWSIVKGISDFADDLRDEEIESQRPVACYNAVRFVMSALVRAESRII